MLTVFTLSGCVAPELSSDGVESSEESPQRISFESVTHQGGDTAPQVLDLREAVNGEDAPIHKIRASSPFTASLKSSTCGAVSPP